MAIQRPERILSEMAYGRRHPGVILFDADSGEHFRLAPDAAGDEELVRVFLTGKETAGLSETAGYDFVITEAGELSGEEMREAFRHVLGIGRTVLVSSGFQIRELDYGDREVLLSFSGKDAGTERSALICSETSGEAILDYHRSCYAVSDCGCFLILRDGQPVGIGGGERYYAGEACGSSFGLSLLPEARGKGFGTSLTEIFTDCYLTSCGLEFVFSETSGDNEVMLRVLRKNGFVPASSDFSGALSRDIPEGFLRYVKYRDERAFSG